MSGSRNVEPNSGTMPSGTNGSWKRAFGAAYTRSQCRSMVVPMPTAGPPTAATTGFFMCGSTLKSACAGEVPGSRRTFTKSWTSLPAVKHSAVPCRSTARTCGSSSAWASAFPSIGYISTVIAFFLSIRSKRTRATLSLVSLLIKTVILELLPQGQLRELAGRGMRQLVHEHDVVGHPPLRNLAFVEAQQLVLRDLLPQLLHRHHDRALVPLRVAHADHRGLGDRGVRHRDVLEVDRADPLAAGLDHVLRAIGDLDVAIGIDRAYVAGRKPSHAQGIAALALEIALDHPRSAHLQVAELLAVPGQLASVFVDDAEIHAEDRAPLLALDGFALLLGKLVLLRLQRSRGAERAHLGHPPRVQHLHAVLVLEGADHRGRARRAADHHAFQRREAQVPLLHVRE